MAAEAMPPAAPAWFSEIKSQAPQASTQNLGLAQHGSSHPRNALFNVANSLNTEVFSVPETFSIPFKPVLRKQVNEHVFAAQGLSINERSSEILENTTTFQGHQSTAWPIISSNTLGESWKDALQPLDMLPEEAVQDLFEAKLVSMGTDFNSPHSSSGDSPPFGNSSQAFQQNFPHSSAQGSFGPAVFSPFSVPSTALDQAAEPAATLSLEQAQWPLELAEKLSLLSRSGKNFMTLKLQPESFGKITVRVETQGTHVSTLVQTEHPVVREMLQSNISSLRDLLADQGLQLSHFSVDVRHSNTPFSHEDNTLWEPKAQSASVTVSLHEKPEETLNSLDVLDGDLAGILSVRV
ncbi:flagellar hook-length control protein FliK [Desulfosoma caldarium]|uniref:flagellar hook-length control protein FliK n=1 Tax=Desulfosoma caldarium TaxID=610254 RepID=UPI001475B096|nr:flagellar hook-length control protein FliK [Desulfosoma caldarium]